MSIDYDCYLTRKPFFRIRSIIGENWQISVHGPMKVEREDLSNALIEHIGRRSWLFQIHIEGVADEETYQKFGKLHGDLIKKYDACIFDPQLDIITNRAGEKAVIEKQAKRKKVEPISLAFYFDDGLNFDLAKKTELYKIMETFAPKCLPRRYGCYEPMQYSLEEHGKDHFLDLWEKDDGLFWRGYAPFQWVFNSINKKPIAERRGYLCSQIEFQISAKILNTKKSLGNLLKFQIEASKALNVFYSEIKYHEYPGTSWGWRGLPNKIPMSVCIGPPYSELWSEFQDGAENLGNGIFWRNYIETGLEKLQCPPELVKPEISEENPYNSAPCDAEIFPFKIYKRPKGIP
ncbi:MAG: hypothetical protein L3J65_07885 [Robiginitomaculum sp.]|nr:hypothetical protein [Robiginitomaculum sp.]